MIFDLNETIIAISSVPGDSFKGVIRLSGPEAVDALENVWFSDIHKPFSEFSKEIPIRKYVSGKIVIQDNLTIPANIIVFRSPQSYTTEDMIEIHLPGSHKLINMALAHIKSFPGLRDAQPGEFTARAFLNGRIDLTEAEAVAEVIHASGDAQLKAAENLLAGALHKNCSRISKSLAELLALVEAGIDFSDQEDISFIEPDIFSKKLKDIIGKIDTILEESISWQDLHNLPKVVLLGPPNAGKSSLMNKLTNLDRSIVCSIAGTTRDILSAPIKLPMGECLLIDTPGLGAIDDLLASESQQRVIEIINNADLVLFVWDPGDYECANELLAKMDSLDDINILTVANKQDIYDSENIPGKIDCEIREQLYISALTGYNLDKLLHKVSEILHHSENQLRTEAIALTARQYSYLSRTNVTLRKLHDQVQGNMFEEEIIALQLREALDFIGEISGEIASDEVLGNIFSRFCIGK